MSSGDLSRQYDLLVGLGDLDIRLGRAERRKRAERWQATVKPAEGVVEQLVHLSMQREERIAITVTKVARAS
jgi:hypothetical protein